MCKTRRTDLIGYAEATLSARRMEIIGNHVRTCAFCTEIVEVYRDAVAGASPVATEAASPAQWQVDTVPIPELMNAWLDGRVGCQEFEALVCKEPCDGVAAGDGNKRQPRA